MTTKKLFDNEYLEEDKKFSTFDLGLAATLVNLEFELRELDKTNPRKVEFIFQQTKGIQEAADRYWSNICHVNARTLVDNIKMLKNRIYSE